MNSERVEGAGQTSFFPMIDDLTRRIKLSFNIAPRIIASDLDRNIDEITTSSPEALKYYSENTRGNNLGDHSRSISLLEKAIAVDSDFAIAYRDLGVIYSNLGESDKFKEYTQKAMELSDRVSDRERYTIQGTFYMGSEKTVDKAIEAFHKLLDLYPDDPNGNRIFPLQYFNIGKPYKAIELYEKARQRLNKDIGVYTNSAYYPRRRRE